MGTYTNLDAQEIMSKGWNRALLFSAISLKIHERKNEQSDNNFELTLSATQTMFANEVFRSGYYLGFLDIKDLILETELEARLVEKRNSSFLNLSKVLLILVINMYLNTTESGARLTCFSFIVDCIALRSLI